MHRLSKFISTRRRNVRASGATVVVAGATGQLGAPTVRELLLRQINVQVLVRDLPKARSLLGTSPQPEVRQPAFDDVDSLAGAMAGADAVFVALGE